MLQSKLFTKTIKQDPKDEVSKNAKLLMRGGYIYKEMAGVYAFLPLGLKVVEKIKQIMREEMDAIGGQEILMTSLQRKELWQKTDRWDDNKVDVWFKSKLQNGKEVGFGWSHEEPISDMMKQYIASYKDLPVYVYQFQTKLRNELRAKSGILRGREFVMKDMYSYSIDQESHDKFYNQAIEAYMKVFERVGLKNDTFLTFASGGAFTEYSHEFQTISEVGEDTIYVSREKKIAINEEVYNDETLARVGVTKEELEKVSAVEVGNIFDFGTVKSEQLGLMFSNEKSKQVPVHLGSYGIGVTRLMGMLVEKFGDENKISWPKQVSPFDVHLIGLNLDDKEVMQMATNEYKKLVAEGTNVLFDDRVEASAGQKFAEADFVGAPSKLVVSKKTVQSGKVEILGS